MSQEQNPITFVNVKRVTTETDTKGRARTKLTVGLNKDGVNDFDKLLTTLEQYRGKQVNLDIRVGEQESADGRTFPTAFIMINEMIPKDDPRYVRFTPKPGATKSNVKAGADRIRKSLEG